MSTNSNANNANNKSNPVPWTDWNINETFLKEVNDYCTDCGGKFVDVVDTLIENAPKGLHKIQDVLVRLLYFSSSFTNVDNVFW